MVVCMQAESRLTKLLCCRWRSRKLNQRKPQTHHLRLHMVATLGLVLSVMALVDLAAHMGALTVGLALGPIGLLEVLAVGLVDMVGMVVVAVNLAVVTGVLAAVV